MINDGETVNNFFLMMGYGKQLTQANSVHSNFNYKVKRMGEEILRPDRLFFPRLVVFSYSFELGSSHAHDSLGFNSILTFAEVLVLVVFFFECGSRGGIEISLSSSS
jgi:hypothetical protein